MCVRARINVILWNDFLFSRAFETGMTLGESDVCAVFGKRRQRRRLRYSNSDSKKSPLITSEGTNNNKKSKITLKI